MCVHDCQKAHLHIAVNYDFVQLRIDVISNIIKYIVKCVRIHLTNNRLLSHVFLVDIIDFIDLHESIFSFSFQPLVENGLRL